MDTITDKTPMSPAEIASAERARKRAEQQQAGKAKKPAAKKEPKEKAEKPAKATKPRAPKPDKPAKAEKPAKVAKEKKESAKDTGVAKVIELCKREEGATTAQMQEVTGWENAGWNTIMASIAKRHDLKLTIGKREAEGSKRKLNVFKLA